MKGLTLRLDGMAWVIKRDGGHYLNKYDFPSILKMCYESEIR